MLRKALTEKSIDRSDSRGFSFGFFCDRCGKEWRSRTMAFTAGGFTAIEHEDARQLLWEQEHRAAFNEANPEAHLQFNRCPQCGRRVCDDCFCIENDEFGGACKDCCK